MCRWITLLSSDPVSLSDIVLAPSNSLVQLSKDASFHPGYSEMNNHVTNGDGFGVGWYHSNFPLVPAPSTPPRVIINPNQPQSQPRSVIPSKKPSNETPNKIKKAPTNVVSSYFNSAVFKDIQPAWNNSNLRELCLAIRSHCIMAHVRAASSFAGISQQNCHPFKAGRLLFCHNGRIDQFDKVRRRFHALLSDEAFLNVKGTTDSEIIFALLCTYLSEDEIGGSPFQQTEPFGHERLTAAIKKVFRTIERILEDADIHDQGYSTCNFSLTDGETMVVTRFCDKSPSVPPPSLYFAFGDSYKLCEELTHEVLDGTTYAKQSSSLSSASSASSDDSSQKSGSDNGSDFDEKSVHVEQFDSQPGTVYADVDVTQASFIVASCPLTRTHTWHPMPKNSIMWYTRGSLPELRLLKRRQQTRSFVMMKS